MNATSPIPSRDPSAPQLAPCGFDCSKCSVRIATLARGADDQGRSCTGCLEPGVKLPFCAECNLRQ